MSTKKTTATPSSVSELSIEHVATHAICEAKAYLIYVENVRSGRVQAAKMVRAAVRELILEGMRDGHFPPEKSVERVVARAFKGIEFDGKDTHMRKMLDTIVSIGNVFETYELDIIGGAIPVHMSYEGIIVRGVADGVVYDRRRGYKYPLVVDISLTKYEPEYNPILYHCDVVSSYYNPIHDTTKVCVVNHKTRWLYSHTYYHPRLYSSISERARAIVEGSCAFRFGWWCAGCELRGSCFVVKT